MTIPRPRLGAPLWLAVGATLLFTLALGQTSLWEIDEAFYTQMAREMVQRGDPLTLHWNGQPWFGHPPLYIWLVALVGRIFGFSEFVARIWSALFGAAGVVVTYLWGRRIYDHRTGVLAGLILMTTLEFFVLSRLAVFDVPLVVFMLAALYMAVVAMEAPADRQRRHAYRWAFLWAGLATITKGPIGLALPALIIGVWWLVRGEWRRQAQAVPWDGFLLYGAVGLTWYVVEAVRQGLPFLRIVVGYYIFTRVFGAVDGQSGPWHYYAPVLLVGGFPWSAFLLPALVLLWRRQRQERYGQLLLLWIGITVVFYSSVGTKLPNYVLPVFPAAALATARLWTSALSAEDPLAGSLLRWGMLLLIVSVIGAAALVGQFGRSLHPQEYALLRPHVLTLGVLPAVGTGAAVALFLWRRAAALVALVLTMTVTLGTAVLVSLPQVEAFRPMKPVALLVRRQLDPGDRVVAVEVPHRVALLYYVGSPVSWTEGVAQTRRAICGSAGAFVVTSQPVYDHWLRAALGDTLLLLARQKDLLVFRTTQEVPCASP